MVQLEEVADEDFFATQPGPKEDEDDWDTDDGTLG
jgi:import receptor subunit TOM22